MISKNWWIHVNFQCSNGCWFAGSSNTMVHWGQDFWWSCGLVFSGFWVCCLLASGPENLCRKIQHLCLRYDDLNGLAHAVPEILKFWIEGFPALSRFFLWSPFFPIWAILKKIGEEGKMEKNNIGFTHLEITISISLVSLRFLFPNWAISDLIIGLD